MTSVGALDVLVIGVAALWGAAMGALLPRAAYRFSAPAGEPWRDRCPGGHPVRGWLGRAWCGACAGGEGAYAVQDGGTHAPRASHAPQGGSHAPNDGPFAPDGGPFAPDGGPSVPNDGPPAPGNGSYAPGPALPAVVTALVCAALAGAAGVRPELVVWLLLAPVGVLLAVVDLRVARLPDPLTLPFAGAALALLGVAAFLPEHAGSWTTALLGALALGAGYFALWLINPAGMGFGDVKLALGAGAVLGWYGWATVMLGTLAGFLLGAVYGGALVLARRAGRKTAIAFGPFLVAGAFLGVLAGAYAA
ncbi:prepilin peptidase [Streptomyces sp. NPDC000134]|uniref:prepilin peptidase n=1 Tax=Streptomyces sp. NPDC000134 TaxID=3364536 RepID=UPI0036CCC6A5